MNNSFDLSRYFLSSFSNPENGERARRLLIEKLKAAISSEAQESVVPASPAEDREGEEEETWEQTVKRRKMERQQEVVNLYIFVGNIEFSAKNTHWSPSHPRIGGACR